MADRSQYPSEQADKFVVRFPDGMRDRIAEAAKAAGRSMNAEIVARLEASFDGRAISGDQAEFIKQMMQDLLADLRRSFHLVPIQPEAPQEHDTLLTAPPKAGK